MHINAYSNNFVIFLKETFAFPFDFFLKTAKITCTTRYHLQRRKGPILNYRKTPRKHPLTKTFIKRKSSQQITIRCPRKKMRLPERLHANTYSVSLFGFLAALSHCLEKFSKMENEKFCLKETR